MKMTHELEMKYKDLEYPFNLMLAIMEDDEFLETVDMIPDLEGSIEYALHTLTKREREIIKHRFVEGMNLGDVGKIYQVTRERIRQVETKALRKLRHPNRLKYIEKGVLGVFYENRENYLEQVMQIENQLIALCKMNAEKADEVIKDEEIKKKYAPLKIKYLDFSVRTHNCLARHGIDNIEQLAKTPYNEMARVRNLGKRSLQEVIDKLEEYGYTVNYTVNGEKRIEE